MTTQKLALWVIFLALTLTLSQAEIAFPDEDEAEADEDEATIDHAAFNTDGIQFPVERFLPEVPCHNYKGERGMCRLLIQCTTFFAEIAELSRSPCSITGEQQGVCCPISTPPQETKNVLPKPEVPFIMFPNIDLQEVNSACQKGIDHQQQRESLENDLVRKNIVAPVGSPVFFHARLFETTDDVVRKGKAANTALAASNEMAHRFSLTTEQKEFGINQIGLRNTILGSTCPPEPICPETKYRTTDGACNNLRNKSWGKAATAFQRIIPPAYSDGLERPRRAVDGSELPSARILSSRITLDRQSEYDNFTLLIMQWGQFLDHDITHTPITKGADKSDISCCIQGQRRSEETTHPECMPIEIPENDPFYSGFGQRCMEFVRSLPALRDRCSLGPREQMNQITAFIDASNVYGSSDNETNELRSFQGGRLKVTVHQGRHLLPGDTNALGCVGPNSQGLHCFKAGDSRVNEQPDLAVLHTIWMRQHNRLADGLARVNPGWTDEILFQEARRIVAAQMQHITYNEYLPIILGRRYTETYALVPRQTGFFRGHRADVDPSINNAFASAAFRYGHTLISTTLRGYDRFGIIKDDLELSRTQFSPFMLYNRGTFDALLRGLAIQPSQRFDRFFTKQLTEKLFAQSRPFGMDLVALNIQRGRDHGIPAYNQWRRICELPDVTTWSDLSSTMNRDVIQNLQAVYKHVDDIDLFIGGISENPVAGSLLGPTFLCVVGDQFYRLKVGDRFYYENGGMESSFSEAQLDEVRKTSLARVVCDNSDDLDVLQPLVFVRPHFANKRALCSSDILIPRMSLRPWRNEPVWA